MDEYYDYIEKCRVTFADRAKRLRLDKGWTKKEAAERLGISASSIKEYEEQGAQPTLNSLLRFSNVYDVSVDWLIGRTDLRRIPTKESLSGIQELTLQFGVAVEELKESIGRRDGE